MSVARHPGASLVAAVGGAQMLKVVSISPHGLAEKRSLRLTSKVTSEVNFSINDVEWCCKDAARHVLASGASNGHILLWDVSRDGRTSQVRPCPFIGWLAPSVRLRVRVSPSLSPCPRTRPACSPPTHP